MFTRDLSQSRTLLLTVSSFCLSDAREVFDLFDFWDGRDGDVDAFKLGDLLRGLGLNPTLKTIKANGGKEKMGEFSDCVHGGRKYVPGLIVATHGAQFVVTVCTH